MTGDHSGGRSFNILSLKSRRRGFIIADKQSDPGGPEYALEIAVRSVWSGNRFCISSERFPRLSDESPRVLIIEFIDHGGEELQEAMVADGLQVAIQRFKRTLLTRPFTRQPDLILLVLGAEQGGGPASCRNFRSAYPQCSICLVHEDLSEWEESVALELGADVVVHRASGRRRILAQVRALLRRQGLLQVSRLRLSPSSRTVTVDGRSIPLTETEFELLSVLAGQPGAVVSRDDISRYLRGKAHDDGDRTIDLCVARLRRKLGDDPRHPVFIRTVRGEGYALMVGDS